MRWKYFIPVFVLVVLVFVINIFFLDSILKISFISAGEMVFGAKVEIASVKTKFSNLSIKVSGVAVANRNDIFKNLIEIESVSFALKPLPLLSKKVLIDEMAVDGIKWGTKRSISGALPPRKEKKYVKKSKKDEKESAVSKMLSSAKDKVSNQISALPAAEKIKDAQNELKNISFSSAVSMEDLKSIKELDALKAEYAQKYAKYDTELKSLDLGPKIAMANKAISEISSIKIESVQDIAPAKEKLDSFNSSHEELSKTISQLQALQSQVSADFGNDKDILKRINELKDSDYRALADKLKLPDFSFGNISQAIFGPVWMGKAETVITYLNLIKKYMPPKKKKEKIVKTRLHGRDISFPKKDNPPDFLISKILISGSTGGTGKEGEPLDFKGIITDITSDPGLLGRPTKMDISGAQGKRKLGVNGVFDHTTENPVDSLSILFAGFPAESLGIPVSEYLPNLNKGSGTISSQIVLKEGIIDSNMELKVSGYSTEEQGVDETRKMILSLWKGIPEITVNAKLTGTLENISFNVSSNIDKILSERLKNLLGAKFAEVQNKLKEQIDKLTNKKKEEVLGEFNSKKSEIIKGYSDKQGEIQSKLNDIKSKTSQKENEAKEQTEKEKKKAEDALSKQAEEKLKELNLFK